MTLQHWLQALLTRWHLSVNGASCFLVETNYGGNLLIDLLFGGVRKYAETVERGFCILIKDSV